MGTLTLTQMRTRLSFNLKGRTLTDGDADYWLNSAYYHLSSPEVRRHKELLARYDFSLVTDTTEYSLSAATVGYDIAGIRDVTYYEGSSITVTTDRNDVKPRSIAWMNVRKPSSGEPQTYALDGDLIVFGEAPTSVQNGNQIRITLWRQPTPLSGTATTVLASYWDYPLLKGAQWLAELDLGYIERAELTKQEYTNLINERLDDYELNAEDTGQRVRVRVESPMPVR